MSRNIGIRADPAKTMIKTAKTSPETNDKIKILISMNMVISVFMYPDPKIKHEDWAKINISSMIQEGRDNCDIKNLTYQLSTNA